MLTHYLTDILTIRDSSVLTASYVETGIQDIFIFNQIVLYVSFTIGSLTSAELVVEFSNDGSVWYQECDQAISAGLVMEYLATHRFVATGNYRIPVPVCDKYMRVSVRGNGTVDDSLMKIELAGSCI